MATGNTGDENVYLQKIKDNADRLIAAPEAFDPSYECYKLRQAGVSWREAAMRTGYKDERIAAVAVRRYLSTAAVALSAVKREEVLNMELSRLDELQSAYWDAAVRGDDKAAMIVLKIIQQRSRLFGIDDPNKQEHGSTQTTILVNGGGMTKQLEEIVNRTEDGNDDGSL
jgi:preprotein translocase subunit SecD